MFLTEALGVPETLIATSQAYQRIVEYGPSTHEAATVGVNPDYFSDLGVRFLLGTDLAGANANEITTNAVVSERFWRDELGAQPRVVGRALTIGDQPFTIVGATGGGFEGLRRGVPEDIWTPLDAALDAGGPASSVPGGPAETVPPIMRRLTDTFFSGAERRHVHPAYLDRYRCANGAPMHCRCDSLRFGDCICGC